MDAREITIKDGETIGWQCGKCTGLYTLNRFEEADKRAERCCGPGICDGCGKSTSPHWTLCDACRSAKDREREKIAYDKATKIPLKDYMGAYLYMEGLGNEGYVGIDELQEILAEEDAEVRPTWGWACDKMSKPRLDLEDTIRESALEEFHESAGDAVDWKKVAEAQVLIDDAMKDVTSYSQDMSTVVFWAEEKNEENDRLIAGTLPVDRAEDAEPWNE